MVIEKSFALPRLIMPDRSAIAMGPHGEILFTLETPAGAIFVNAWSTTWHCQGPEEAFIAHGLLRPAWLPGAPGNNKVQQRVRFGTGGLELVFGRSGDAENCITITRLSKRTCRVVLPVSSEQAESISAYREQAEAARKAEQAKAAEHRENAKRQLMPVHEVRAEAKHYADVAADLILRRIESSAFRLDPAADRQLREHFRQISSLIDGAKMIPADSPSGGNVIRLRR